jgi:hypothetical protein
MKDPRVNELLKIPRGDSPISDSRWSDVEKALGLQLPGSYKRLIDVFGPSRWSGFLQILIWIRTARGITSARSLPTVDFPALIEPFR